MNDLEPFDLAVLEALVEGFQARSGAKERFQALSEYEIARRAGTVSCSYVEYDSSPERDRVRSALARLERQGLVRAASFSGRYETFMPTERSVAVTPLAAGEEAAASPPAAVPIALEQRLDEIIRLLRSIDERLARGKWAGSG
jgi:hypothetical protein